MQAEKTALHQLMSIDLVGYRRQTQVDSRIFQQSLRKLRAAQTALYSDTEKNFRATGFTSQFPNNESKNQRFLPYSEEAFLAYAKTFGLCCTARKSKNKVISCIQIVSLENYNPAQFAMQVTCNSCLSTSL